MTTKTSGLGLGLAISRDILRDCEASIEAGAAPEGGASFTVRFRRPSVAAAGSAGS